MARTINTLTQAVLYDETYSTSELLQILKEFPLLREKIWCFDLDNTLFVLNDKDKRVMSTLHLPGAYRHLPVIQTAAFFVNSLAELVGWDRIAFLSHCCPQNVDGSRADKTARVLEVFPDAKKNMIIVSAAGTPKSSMVRDSFHCDDIQDFILFDDYWPNLQEFTAHGGKAIRVYNGVNAYRSKNWSGMQVEVR